MTTPKKLYTSMEKKYKTKWLKALRGEEYKRCTGTLRRVNKKEKTYSFCCLGVLCDIMINGDGQWDNKLIKNNGRYRSRFIFEGSGSYDMPSDKVNNETGLTKSSVNMLARMNDNGASFEKIAKWIEAEL